MKIGNRKSFAASRSKSKRPGQRLDWAAFGFLLAGLLVSVSILSDERVSAPSVTLYPAIGTTGNLLGRPGAWLAESLYATLGVAVYVLLASWFILVILLFLRKSWLTWLLRLLGWLLLLPCVAVIADRLGPERLSGPVTGSGGTVGAWLSAWLEARFLFAGQALILASSSALSLLLALDFALARLLRGAFTVARWAWAPLRFAGTRIKWRSAPTYVDRPNDWPEVSAGSAAEDAPHNSSDIPIYHHHQLNSYPDGSPVSPGDPESVVLPPPIIRPSAVSDDERFADFELPPLTLLDDAKPFPHEEHDRLLRERAALLEKTFTDFGLNIRVVGINTGPVITQYEVALETGLRVHKVTRLADDLALNLKVPSVRIVAPVPGKNTVGIEIPNENRAVVRLKEVLLTAGKKMAQTKIPLFLGKDTEGRPLVYDLAEMPHLLIAGRTGTGKSVSLNSIILSMLMTRRPDEVKMIMIDPKMVELIDYGKIPHLMHPIVKDMKKAEAILSWAVDKMEERYDLLSRVRVRNIAGYNELGPEEIHRRLGPVEEEERAHIPDRMPHIVIIVDELSDLMMMLKKEVEEHIIRLAQKSRAAGIHLVVATQKPTVDVITGLIKSNLPARICFQVSSRSDSRVVLDEIGGEKLLGKGDMLFLQPGTSTLIRAQGTYAGDEEISRVVDYLECDPCYVQELVQLKPEGAADGKGSFLDSLRARDELYEPAIEIILREGRGSVSLLQRALGIGYGRAARLIDFMAEDGIVGAYNGSNAREVLYTPEQWTQVKQEKEQEIAKQSV
jgi:S-DNA-T family DNA segregation ATPase FtsK/SpoIIIE